MAEHTLIIFFMGQLIWRIAGATLGIFLSDRFISGVNLEIIPGKSIFFGVEFTQSWQILILMGATFGGILFFIKPILDKITAPLKVLTLGLFSLVLNMALIWLLDILFPEFQISGLVPLFYTTVVLWTINYILRL